MPDWITHIAVAWILCTVLGFKYKQFTPANTAIAMLGALLPDLMKVTIVAEYFGYNIWDYLTPIHLPMVSFIIAAMISLLFNEKKMVFLFLALGVVTHYALDILLVGQGIYLLYPFYWGQWHLDLIASDDLNITIIALAVALVVYLISLRRKKLAIS